VIERSIDLSTWTMRGETSNQLGTAQFFEPLEASGRQLFYRAVLKP
jgi:hypothetical protein